MRNLILAILCVSATAMAAEPKVGEAVSYENLTVWPLYAASAEKPANYLALDEASDKKLVRVREKGPKGSGDVNTVIVENKSSRPLVLLAGEMILGGKQDRIMGQDTVVPPKTTQDVAVFCVEHGRWDGRTNQFSSGKAMAHSKLRAKARFKDQGEVWKEVSEKNGKMGTANATDTYRTIATSKDIDAKVKAYADHVIGGLDQAANKGDMVGFAIAVNGDVKAVERFGSPALFQKYKEKLLRSYFIEAVDQPIVAAAKKPAKVEVEDFVAKGKAGRKADVAEGTQSKTVHFDAADVQGAAVIDSRAPATAAPVYESFQKE